MNLSTGLNLLKYLRKSRADLEAEQRGEGETLSKHRRTLAQYAEKYNHNIVATFEEVVSGERIVDRPEMQKLLHAVQEGVYGGVKIDGVLVMDADRLGRGDMIDQGIIAATFKSAKALIVTPRKTYDPEDEFDEEYFEFESFMARRELKIINRRLQRGRRISASEGKHVAKKPPYGYVRSDDLVLRPHPEEAEIVRLIFEWSAHKEWGRSLIANKLTEMGVKSPSGKDRWDRSAVSYIIHNRVYTGDIVWGKGQWRKGPGGGYRQVKKTDPKKWTVKEGAHEPLVDLKTAKLAQELGKKRELPVPKEKTLSNPLASLVYCSDCGHSMRRQPRVRGGNRKDRLLCNTYRCENKSTSFDLVESRILETLRTFLAGLESQTEKPKKDPGSLQNIFGDKVKNLEQQLQNLQKQSSNIHDLLEQGIYSIEKFIERNKEIEERMAETILSLEESRTELRKIEEQAQQKDVVIPKLVNVLSIYDSLSPQGKNDLLKGIIERAEYKREIDSKRPEDFSLEVYLNL